MRIPLSFWGRKDLEEGGRRQRGAKASPVAVLERRKDLRGSCFYLFYETARRTLIITQEKRADSKLIKKKGNSWSTFSISKKQGVSRNFGLNLEGLSYITGVLAS